MVTIEEKIKLFTELIYQKIEKENEEELKKFNDTYTNLIEEKKKEFEIYIENLKQERTKKINEESKKIISKANYEQKRMILKKKSEIFERFFEDLKIKSKEFINKDRYKQWLLKNFDEVLKTQGQYFKIIITEKDYELLKEKLQQSKINNVEFDEKIIGGFILENQNKLRIDSSILTIIENNKEKIGQILFANI